MNKADQVKALVEKAGGKLFSVQFVKKDGTVRSMTCRREVHKFSSGGTAGYSSNLNNVGVYEFCERQGKQAYRCFNAENVIAMKVNGKEYKF